MSERLTGHSGNRSLFLDLWGAFGQCNRRKFAVKGWIQQADALFQRRMSGEHIEPEFGEAVSEKEVAGLFGFGRVKFRTGVKATNLLESASEAKRVPGELHSAG